MEDLPVSFSWIYPKIKTDGTCVAYCFAYIRDPKTYNVLYAGVKYNGNYCDLKKFKKNLRKTAIERLYKKPIYAIFSLGDDESYKKNLSDPDFKFNGYQSFSKTPKKSISLGKFFLYCALHQPYSNLGICANKSSSDLRFSFCDEKYDVLSKGQIASSIFYVKYGYEYRGDELKRITLTSTLNDSIFNLRKRSKFYGKGNDRRKFEDYPNIEDDYLLQFGFSKNHIKEKTKEFKVCDYVMNKGVIYYRVNLSNNVQAHIAFMEFTEWNNFVGKVYGKDLFVNIPGMLFNTYCMGYTIQRNYNNKNDKLIYRKIAVDRMIDRPSIVDADFFDVMTIKDLREWFGMRLGYFSQDGIGRIDYLNDLYLTSDYYHLENHNENIRIYSKAQRDYVLNDVVSFLFAPVKYVLSFFGVKI